MSILKILIVDDDMVSRTKMTTILSSVGNCHVVEDGQQALQEYLSARNSPSPYDLIVLDIDMPGIQGTEVLARIRSIENQVKGRKRPAKILMITSHKDRDSVVKSVRSGCDGYIVKPFDAETLFAKIESVGFKIGVDVSDLVPAKTSGDKPQTTSDVKADRRPFREAIADEIRLLTTGKTSLPTQPDVYLELKDMVAQGVDLHRIADVLKNHAAITGKLIKISNTAMYRGVKPNQSLAEAIARLGLKQTMQQVCAICTQGMCNDLNEKYESRGAAFWQASLACAYACEILVKQLKPEFNADPFTMGLMHDIGKLALLRVVEQLETKGQYEKGLNWDEILPVIEKFQGVLGSALLKQWALPEEYQTVARNSGKDDAEITQTPELRLVNFAIKLVQSLDSDKRNDVVQSLAKTYGNTYPGIDQDRIAAIVEQIDSAVKEGVKAMS